MLRKLTGRIDLYSKGVIWARLQQVESRCAELESMLSLLANRLMSDEIADSAQLREHILAILNAREPRLIPDVGMTRVTRLTKRDRS